MIRRRIIMLHREASGATVLGVLGHFLASAGCDNKSRRDELPVLRRPLSLS